MSAVLRQARAADVPAMHRVRMSVRENRLVSTVITEADTREAIETLGRGWVVEADGQIVAFAIGNARTGNIWALFVDPEHERRGYGRRLHDTMVEWLWAQGPEQLWLTTDPATRAAHFYEVAGWHKVGTTEKGEARYELSRRSPMSTATDKVFAGSIPKIYEAYLVPLIFESYAADIAERLAARAPGKILEIAAGTGVVTRAMAATLPDAAIVATDLNQAMLDKAAAVGTHRPVEWRQADAMKLPFPDGTFDAVVCQFGVMFFPDKPKAFAEARRVLKRGGSFIFNVWDALKDNEFPDVITKALAPMFPQDPPRFLARTPYGYNDKDLIKRHLAEGGFTAPADITTVTARSRARSARDAALGFCQGTPLRAEIEARDASRLEAATAAAAEAIAKQFGESAVDGKIQALVVTVTA